MYGFVGDDIGLMAEATPVRLSPILSPVARNGRTKEIPLGAGSIVDCKSCEEMAG